MYQYATPNTDKRAFGRRLRSFLYRGIMKNAIDSVAALMALIVLSPLILLISVRIKRDSPGPIFIQQKCKGLRGYPFRMYKFRTHKLISVRSNQGSKYVQRETYFGKILKEANLENIPQLFNVFMSDMSLVGPRPEPVKLTINNVDIDQVIPEYQSRRLVKPGMTGWARINGLRGPLRSFGDAVQRVSYDIDYTRYASLKVDCYILFKTLPFLKRA